ncbi:1726_t:CDS:2 [Ambispora gerdemannii]|uniref:1726_t:CDS:1 n=1 Tax=Ambispora gerdemannii TaxID=144530 RepID=A0A9N9C600_9GLOM|nr:1726_t:CDS:2 [Ambispora gerdemannii]
MATTNNLIVGARCEIHGDRGIIRYVGHTDFQPGKWVGVELEKMNGKNNGSVNGKQYFECKPNHGVFVRASQIKTILPSAEGESSMVQGQTPQPDTSFSSSNRETPEPRFAPANDPTLLKARERLKSPTLLTSSTAALRSSSLKQPSSPSSTRTSFALRTPTTPTFSRPRSSEHIDDDATAADDTIFDEPIDASGDVDLSMASAGGSTAPSLLNTANIGGSEYNMRETPTVSLKEYEELRLKLKIMENKRQEDREKMREAELLRQEAAQFTSIKPKLQG